MKTSLRARCLAIAACVGASSLLMAILSCQNDVGPFQPCTNIPAGGCPLSNGLACDDPSCQAVYLCMPDRTWQLDHACPARDAAPDVAAPPADASVPFDATDELPPGASGGPGCGALEPPDCPLSLGAACPSGCCGCEDLFVCQGGGWNAWGSCGEAGLVPNH